MEVILMIGIGLFLGWLVFSPKGDNRTVGRPQADLSHNSRTMQEGKHTCNRSETAYPRQDLQHMQERQSKNHTLRNVAGGMVAGAVLGHMLSNDHKSEAHETINNYNTYNDYDESDDYDEDDYEDSEYDDYEDADSDDDYEDDYSSDYDSYDSSDYDSGSDWGDDSYDGGDW